VCMMCEEYVLSGSRICFNSEGRESSTVQCSEGRGTVRVLSNNKESSRIAV
jgi:hypothetical protein